MTKLIIASRNFGNAPNNYSASVCKFCYVCSEHLLTKSIISILFIIHLKFERLDHKCTLLFYIYKIPQTMLKSLLITKSRLHISFLIQSFRFYWHYVHLLNINITIRKPVLLSLSSRDNCTKDMTPSLLQNYWFNFL